MMPGSADLEARVRKLLAGQALAVLATQGEAGPHASLVAFAATDDLCRVVFATDRETRKYANLVARPRVALLIDDRSHHESDFHKATAATVLGEAHEANGSDREELLAVYLDAHPHLADFVASPTCALIVVTVESCSVVTQFQNVMELVPDR